MAHDDLPPPPYEPADAPMSAFDFDLVKERIVEFSRELEARVSGDNLESLLVRHPWLTLGTALTAGAVTALACRQVLREASGAIVRLGKAPNEAGDDSPEDISKSQPASNLERLLDAVPRPALAAIGNSCAIVVQSLASAIGPLARAGHMLPPISPPPAAD